MKKTLFTLILFLFLQITYAQTYHVINVKGNITNKTTGKNIKTGDKIKASDKISFANKEAMALVISDKSGRMILKPSKDATSSELLAIVQKSLFSYSGRLSTRSVLSDSDAAEKHILKTLIEIKTHFDVYSYLILGGKTQIKIEAKEFPLTDSTFFFLRYKFNNKIINKRLAFENNFLIIDENTILKIDNNIVSEKEVSNYEMYYYEVKKKQILKICDFNPIFADNKILKPQIQAIINSQKADNKKIIEEVQAYLFDDYGKVYLPNLKIWLKNNFEIN